MEKMLPCEVCGSENFEKHAGFLYCAVCQTQSQNYHEEEYEYRDHKLDTIRRKKLSKPSVRKKKPIFYDDGMWTTWEVFNYILYGMKEEIIKCGVSSEFDIMVFKLWAAYLKECQAAFISKYQVKVPKLGFHFKNRDARILYNVDASVNSFKRKKTLSESSKSALSTTSNSTASTLSRSCIALQKGKVVQADYQELLSMSMESSNYLPDESFDSKDESESLVSSFKQMLTKEEYKLLKSSYQSEKLLMRAKDKSKRDIKSLGKNKLLSIIHLALLMIGSQIQLSDLLRFIREGHLSFAKVTHFLPKNMKLPKNDFRYIEVTSDSLMPTHLHQRKIASKLACLLNIDEIPTPNMDMLVDRYCQELNLPDQLAKMGKKVLREIVPSGIVPRPRSLFPSCEAWAMVSIIFVMKLLFGLNDRSEIFLSRLASEVNAAQTGKPLLFVFEDWQKYIECRKTILMDFHYPTLEQLGGTPRNSKMFLDTMMRESKDEHRNERFVQYSGYYIEEKTLEKVKGVLRALSKPHDVTSLEFDPSLTPQISHLEVIMQDLIKDGGGASEKKDERQLSEFPFSLLKQSFKKCDLQFALAPKNYSTFLIEKNSDLFEKFNINREFAVEPSGKEDFAKDRSNVDVLLKCSSNYWTLKYPKGSRGQLTNFRINVFEKTPKNFQWLISECARMLEMNVRDVYDELLILEQKFYGEKYHFVASNSLLVKAFNSDELRLREK